LADIYLMRKSLAPKQSFRHLVEDARNIGVSPEEVRQIQTVVKSHRLPADVQAVELSFGRDWAGGPAAWILYLVEDDNSPSSEKIARLSKFTSLVQDALLKTSPSYWPYVNVRAIH
jgi:hypothetical protein